MAKAAGRAAVRADEAVPCYRNGSHLYLTGAAINLRWAVNLTG